MASFLRIVAASRSVLNTYKLEATALITGTGHSIRKSSFLTHLTAEQLWKGVTSVSNAGMRRGRGKGAGRRIAKDLNKGQVLGTGKINMVWPGLNAPVLRGKEVVTMTKLPPDPHREENLIKNRNVKAFATLKLAPIERGWSGAKMHGRSAGKPDTIGEETFEGFDSKILEMRMVFTMKSQFGRTRRMRVICISGNKNGLAGIGIGKSPDGKAAIRKAKAQSVQRLQYIERFDEHTVYHDFYTEFRHTRIFVQKKPKGYGLKCHRVIKAICEMVGITDLHSEVENSVNPLNIVRAFMLGLHKQKTHQELSDGMKMHLVEFRSECDNYPRIVASPQKELRKREEIPVNEITDYKEIVSEGKVRIPKPPLVPFFQKLPGWQQHLRKTVPRRNFGLVKTQLCMQYGEVKSFLTIREEERLKAKELKEANE